MRAPPAPRSIPDFADALLLLGGWERGWKMGVALTHRVPERDADVRSFISCTDQPGGLGWGGVEFSSGTVSAPVLTRAGDLSPSPVQQEHRVTAQ